MRKGRGAEELREFGVERGEDVEEREECLGVIQQEGLDVLFFRIRQQLQCRRVIRDLCIYHVRDGEVGVGCIGHTHRIVPDARVPFWRSFPETLMVTEPQGQQKKDRQEGGTLGYHFGAVAVLLCLLVLCEHVERRA